MEGRAKKIASDARRRAKATDLPYHLRWEWIRDVLEAGRCQLTGLPFDLRMTALGRGPRNPFAPSLDRIVPRLGYTDQNCRVILMAVNTAIGCWGEGVTEHIIRAWIERIDER